MVYLRDISRYITVLDKLAIKVHYGYALGNGNILR